MITFILWLSDSVYGQNYNFQNQLKTIDSYTHFDLFDHGSSVLVSRSIGDYKTLNVQVDNLKKIRKEKPDALSFDVNLTEDKLSRLILIPNPAISEPHRLIDAHTGATLPYLEGSHYIGMIDGDDRSIVAISIFHNHIEGLIYTGRKNFSIGRLNNSTQHVLYEKEDLDFPFEFDCATQMESHTVTEDSEVRSNKNPDNCVKMYVEVEQEVVSQFPNVEEANAFIASLFNQVSALYAQENINLSLSTLVMWSESDPYEGSSLQKLSKFRNRLFGDFDGNLAHLVGFGSGGIGYVNVACNKNFGVAYSGISTFHAEIPTYSWSVEVVTHEIGHNLGSQHTHACVWNGNNTAIDGCGPSIGYTEGCDGPIPTSGTIMSYCHLVNGIGIDFSLGFGQQPGDKIRQTVYNAPCLESCGDCPDMGSLCDDNDPCTINDMVNSHCICKGTYIDLDNDGYCVGNDPNDEDDCIPDPSGSHCEMGCEELNLSTFETASLFWNLGGPDATYVHSSYAYSPQQCVRLRDNTLHQSAIYSIPFDASQASSIAIDLRMYSYSMEPGEQFIIEYSIDGGQSYETARVLKSNAEFHNGQSNHIQHEIISLFSANTVLRLRCHASSNGDQLYLDDINVVICGGNNTSSCDNTGQPCDDLNPCTEGETYDEDCNCNGGQYIDHDNDNYCVGIDPNDTDPCIPNDADCVSCDVTGMACNDGDDCTIGETYNEDCICEGGVYTDNDGDGFCVGDDLNDNDHCIPINVNCSDCNLNGIACDDGDECTYGEYYDSNCECTGGEVIDSDQDGYCLAIDPDDNDPCKPIPSNDNCDPDGCTNQGSDYFVEGWGIWNDGGGDCARVLTSVAHSDNYAIRIRDNSGKQSSLYTNVLDLSTFATVQLQFVFYGVSMENGKKLILEYSENNGGNYQTAKEWIAGTDFTNSTYNYVQYTFDDIEFTEFMRFRLQCVGTSNADLIYIDDIILDGCGIATSDTPEIAYIEDAPESVKQMQTSIYPNPTTTGQLLFIDLPDRIGEHRVEIYDSFGKMLYSADLDDSIDVFSVDTSTYPSGNYFISVSGMSLKEVQQLVILN